MYYTSHPCTPMCRASRVLVKAEAAHRFLVSESHILLRPDDRGKDDGAPQDHSQKVNWWEELESSHDASQAPCTVRAGGQSGQIGFLLVPWNSQITGNTGGRLQRRTKIKQTWKQGGEWKWKEITTHQFACRWLDVPGGHLACMVYLE